jgi:hypothetical protein
LPTTVRLNTESRLRVPDSILEWEVFHAGFRTAKDLALKLGILEEDFSLNLRFISMERP